MAFLPEQSVYEPGIYQLEVTDPLQGGPDGVFNVPPKQLANRTKYLKDRLAVGHEEDGSHKVAALKSDLAYGLTDTEFAAQANLAESKLNLYFKGSSRPSDLGPYTSTRELAEDIGRLTSMNSMGDLLLNKATLDSCRNLCKQFYASSGVLYAGATSLAGHTPVTSGSDGGGIFTIDTATTAMADKLQIAGTVQYLINGFCVRVKSPVTVDLPEADATWRAAQRTDLVYILTHSENVTTSNQFYLQGDRSGTPIDWSGMTEEEQRIAAVLIENNLYVGADYNIYQYQYEWVAVANASTLSSIGYTRSIVDNYMYTDGTYQAIELCTIVRRNQGAYHSVYNAHGTGAFYGESLAHDENQTEHSAVSYAITALGVAGSTFTIEGDHVSAFPTGTRFNVTGAISEALDNSRDYQVASSELVSTDTVITVTRTITDDTGANGVIHLGWPAAPFYDIQATNTTTQTFVIDGDHVAEFPVGFDIEVVGATDDTNDKDYTVTGCVLTDGDTIITVDSAILNTGNTGRLHSVTWFHINYCFTHLSVGLAGENTGSIASGVVAASVTSDKNELAMAHDHIKNTDVTDVRTYLGTAVRETDPNLTLSKPVLTGMPLSVYELDVVNLVIDAYNAALTYNVTATIAGTGTSVGVITRSGANITWTLPEVAGDTAIKFSISASDSASHISPINTYLITARNLNISGDSMVAVGSSDWASLTNATGTSGFVATADSAEGTTNAFIQDSGDGDWGTYAATLDRELMTWMIDGTSTVSSLVLGGNKEVAVGQEYAVKYAGSDVVTVTNLGVTHVSWDGTGLKNTLTLGVALAAIPEMVWLWDGDVAVAAGTASEALVTATDLTIVSGSTTTTQVTGTSSVPNLWTNSGYHNKVSIVVGGVTKEVTVLSVNEAGGTYTLQIPEQTGAPTAAAKPNCFVTCANPTSVVYDSTGPVITTEYAPVVVFGNDIRQLKFRATADYVGTTFSAIEVDLWTEV